MNNVMYQNLGIRKSILDFADPIEQSLKERFGAAFAEMTKLSKAAAKIDETKVSEMAKDPEYTYVEFAFDQPGWTKTCKEDYTMRTMLKEPGEYNWAFVGCK